MDEELIADDENDAATFCSSAAWAVECLELVDDDQNHVDADEALSGDAMVIFNDRLITDATVIDLHPQPSDGKEAFIFYQVPKSGLFHVSLPPKTKPSKFHIDWPPENQCPWKPEAALIGCRRTTNERPRSLFKDTPTGSLKFFKTPIDGIR